MKRFLLPLIVIISTIFIIICTEFYLVKFIGLGQPIVYDPHLLWGYSPKPNKVYYRFKDTRVSINNVGLRSKKKLGF